MSTLTKRKWDSFSRSQSSSLWTACQTSSPFICSIIMWIFAVLFGWCWRRSARVNTGLYSKAIWTVRCFYEALNGHKGKVATHAHLLCACWTFSTDPIRGGRLVIWPCILWLPMLAQEFHLEDLIHTGRHKEPAVYAKHNYPSTWREIHLLSQCSGLAHTGKLT